MARTLNCLPVHPKSSQLSCNDRTSDVRSQETRSLRNNNVPTQNNSSNLRKRTLALLMYFSDFT